MKINVLTNYNSNPRVNFSSGNKSPYPIKLETVLTSSRGLSKLEKSIRDAMSNFNASVTSVKDSPHPVNATIETKLLDILESIRKANKTLDKNIKAIKKAKS